MVRDKFISLALPAFIIVSFVLIPLLGIEMPGESVSIEGRPNRDLNGSNVYVRIYNDWQTDPCEYKLISVPLNESSVSFDAVKKAFPDISESVVVISGPEQKDETVAELIGNTVYTECYKKGKRFFIHPSHSITKSPKEWIVTDALGFLLQKATVEIFIRGVQRNDPHIYLQTATTDEKGQIGIPDLNGSLNYFSFRVSKPDYGISLIDHHIREHKELIVPLVSKTTEAYRRSIYGIIMDIKGNPISGAIIKCSTIRTLGEGLINSLHGWSYKSITDEKGAFSLYLPNENIRDERGYLIPPKSKYNVRIEAPKDLGLLPYVKAIENGYDAMIFLERGARFRTLIFEDDDGTITDPKKLQCIKLSIKKSDGSRVSLGYDDFKDGGNFPLGEYHAVLLRMDELDFEPLTVNEQSPDELIFKLSKSILYHGKIVHGLSGNSMPGAFVIGFYSKARGNLSMITEQQWEALSALPSDPSLTDPAVKPVSDIYGVKKIVRTDEQGCFKMSFRSGEIYGFVAFEKNYLGLQHRRHALISDENRQAEVPVMKLYPAATVLVEARVDTKRISIWPRWIIDENENPVWVREFLATDDRRESLFTYDAWVVHNKVQSFHVPASLNLRVKLDTPYDRQFCPIEIPDLIHLAQGQVLDLGRYEFKPALEVYVQVINSKSQAVEGVPVRMLLNGKGWSVAHNTDESGLARFSVVPNSIGEFGVSYRGKGGQFLKETIPYQIGGSEDSGRQFTLRLSDEIMDLLFLSDGL